MTSSLVLEQAWTSVWAENIMDNDTQTSESTGTAMPRASAFEPSGISPASAQAVAPYAGPMSAADDKDRSGVFERLVTRDGDIAGLVAYSIYKQHKLDWLRAFEAAHGRSPNEAELGSYIIGEGTPRRLATYRHLAEATLSGQGPDVDGANGASPRGAISRRPGQARASAFSPGLIVLYLLIAALIVGGFLLAMRFTVASR